MDADTPRLGERRVHLALLGHERDRIVEPLRRYGADVVYLLADDPDRDADRGAVDHGAARVDPADDEVRWDAVAPYQRAVRDEVASFADTRSVPVRFDDVYDVLGVVTTLAARHAAAEPGATGGVGTASGGAETGTTDRLFVNVSTGPRIAVVGAAIACMAVGARPYGVEPESYVHDVEREPLTEGVAGVVDLPLYPIDAPTRDQVAVLGHLHERDEANRTTDKWNIIEWAADADLAFLRNAGESRTAKYRALEGRVLDPLRERGYVELESVGRSDNVALTPTGERVYFAFAHELHDHSEE
ncbi:HFX_2341 family transcriptional regulator domain-containing protein [Candidatus Halobonum tyrrellensis]|uniref:Uncharacterized protein n=1 Tax=Candidatus Halobonum tyrrellensis G22 TaxID=1324957 RepID=V4IYA4_9EURY|nr:DUF6293 family protein [Candidatus Halobonum tyrrellensis]ESP88132.1 hypothetical protein K933_10592 [Candidatus Halobonum tyrrellensis G22]